MLVMKQLYYLDGYLPVTCSFLCNSFRTDQRDVSGSPNQVKSYRHKLPRGNMYVTKVNPSSQTNQA